MQGSQEEGDVWVSLTANANEVIVQMCQRLAAQLRKLGVTVMACVLSQHSV